MARSSAPAIFKPCSGSALASAVDTATFSASVCSAAATFNIASIVRALNPRVDDAALRVAVWKHCNAWQGDRPAHRVDEPDTTLFGCGDIGRRNVQVCQASVPPSSSPCAIHAGQSAVFKGGESGRYWNFTEPMRPTPPWRTSPVAVATRKPRYNYLGQKTRLSTERRVGARARRPTRGHRRCV